MALTEINEEVCMTSRNIEDHLRNSAMTHGTNCQKTRKIRKLN